MERPHSKYLPDIDGVRALSKNQELVDESAANWLLEMLENVGRLLAKPKDGNDYKGVYLLSRENGQYT